MSQGQIMKRRLQNEKNKIFFITIMLSQFCRTNIVEAASDSIYCGELPKDGSPLVVTYSLEPADERLNGNKYIIFTITKTSVTWTCVDIPINNWYVFGTKYDNERQIWNIRIL